jgi:hypothetical protein
MILGKMIDDYFFIDFDRKQIDNWFFLRLNIFIYKRSHIIYTRKFYVNLLE